MIALTRQNVKQLLTLADCIEAVERAFVRYANGESLVAPGILGAHVPHGGFHIKTAALGNPSRRYFAAKINANFPNNRAKHGRPTIQGVLALFDLETGEPLAVMDSIEITLLRTAAATAVAARCLARSDAHVATLYGCGDQARVHLRALALVRDISRVYAIDVDHDRAAAFAEEMSAELRIAIIPNEDSTASLMASDMWVTLTPSRTPILLASQHRPGVFIAAIGADNPEKHEIEPALLAKCKVVPDLIEQAATIGDLHHALDSGVMTLADVHADLGQVLAGKRPGRTSEADVFVFDSTGTALQDVAAAAIAYERAIESGVGTPLELA
jgi:alanine dehydrogenase